MKYRVGIIKKHREPLVNQGVRFLIDTILIQSIWAFGNLEIFTIFISMKMQVADKIKYHGTLPVFSISFFAVPNANPINLSA